MSIKKRQQGRARRHQHIRKTVSGTALRPRLSVFRSLRHTYAQLVDDETGRTLVAASTQSTELAGELATAKSPVERSFIIGRHLAKKAVEHQLDACVFDRSGYKYWGRVKAVAEGAREGGLKF
jgi:large subunit ribosomal protein L18